MSTPDLTEHFIELIRRTATDLPADVEKKLAKAREGEEEGSAAERALETILANVRMAREKSRPICQDTGTPIFYVWDPQGWSQRALRRQIQQALVAATEKAYMRPNAVDPVTDKNSGNNTGEGFPTIHFEEWEKGFLQVALMLKGGGCENVGRQYSLPNTELKAGRDLAGVRKVVLDAAYQAQGLGCAPGILGVAVGGDRGSSMIRAKEQFFRPLDDANPDTQLASFEQRLYEEGNELGIGPMGFGGKTTLLGVKVSQLHRLPASYFVSVSYMCWADRRRTLIYQEGKVTIE